MKPILFNTEMVRAILDGRKTQTRRIMKPANPFYKGDKVTQGQGLWVDGYKKEEKPNGHIKDYSISSCWWRKEDYIKRYAPYKPGDILWVRETWRDRWGMAYANYGTGNAYPIDDVREIEYKAGGNGFFMHGCNLCPDEPTVKWGEWSKWRPSIYMPREAARIFLRVTNVRVERVQEITEEDAVKEGAKAYGPNNCSGTSARIAFAELWDGVYNNWRENPWVWVYEFERVSEDEL